MDFTKEALQLSACIDRARVVTTICHARPDGDAAGAGVAMASYLEACRGKDAAFLMPDPTPDNLDFLYRSRKPVLGVAEAAARLSSTDLLICLDFNTPSRVEALEPLLRAFKGYRVLIDHHEEPSRADFDLCISETRVSSTCELLFELLMRMPGVDGDASALPRECAEALMTGMTTDTNNFANSVHPGTLQMASALLAAGADREGIIDHLYHSERPNRLAAQGEILSQIMELTPEGAAVIVLPKSFFDRHGLKDGETEGFVNMPLAIKGIRLSILAREDGGQFRVSIRSKRGTSARMLAKTSFHGGGHEQAAGGKILIPEDIAGPDGAKAFVKSETARFMQENPALETD